MSERACMSCRWYEHEVAGGSCHRHAPRAATNDGKKEYEYFTDWPTVLPEDFCGEWTGGSITPEQEAKRELVRRFAVAIVGAGLGEHFADQEVWVMANRMADAESGNSGREI